MRTRIFLIAILSVLTVLSSGAYAQKKKKKNKKEQLTEVVEGIKPAKPLFANNTDTISYIIGNNIGGSFIKNGIDINLDILHKGIQDAHAKCDTLFTPEQVEAIMGAWNQKMVEKKTAAEKILSDSAKMKGQAFLEENRKKEGVKVTASGLQYKVIKEGTGDSPTSSDEVEVHYVGKLIDGTIFDSSRERGTPVTFPVSGVIPGWTEGLQLMKPGSIFNFYIPSDLAYGDKATGPIPPSSVLLFEVELLKVMKATEQK
jgi:FKBP-type peptidyl-prolyl cis-trans isomerase FklB